MTPKEMLEHFNAGNTYKEIADMIGNGCTRNYVAARISDYRKENGIAPSYRGMTKKQKAATIARAKVMKANGFSIYDIEMAEERRKNEKEIVVREDGVKVCPARFAQGYIRGNKYGR